MNVIKGFIVNRLYVNNTPNIVTEIGELSTRGFTFAKEPKYYSSQSYPTLSFIHFPSKDSGIGFNAQISDSKRDYILKTANVIWNKTISGGQNVSPGEFIQSIQTQMPGQHVDIKTGRGIYAGGLSIIEWIQWKDPTEQTPTYIKLWFVNDSFVGQFDEFDITVVSPFTGTERFFDSPPEVKKLLKELTYEEQIEMIDQARGTSSETYVWGKEYDYINPFNENDKTPAKFSALIYGEAGNNIDVIKEAIVNKLLENSAFTRNQWKKILPELFLRTEFMLFPQWNNMAIPHVVGGVNGIYSPIVNIKEMLNTMKIVSVDYPPAHIEENAQTLAFPYMSIAVGSIGHGENRMGRKKLTDWFPDYFYSNNLQTDFNRMSKVTQDWVLLINRMIQIARDLTTYSTIPMGFTRVVRKNKLFISKSYRDVQFLVASPHSP